MTYKKIKLNKLLELPLNTVNIPCLLKIIKPSNSTISIKTAAIAAPKLPYNFPKYEYAKIPVPKLINNAIDLYFCKPLVVKLSAKGKLID